MRKDIYSDEFHSIDLSKIAKSNSSQNLGSKPVDSKTFIKLPLPTKPDGRDNPNL